jgi:Helix-turn-helix domain
VNAVTRPKSTPTRRTDPPSHANLTTLSLASAPREAATAAETIANTPAPLVPIMLTVKEATCIAGIGRTSLYEAAARGCFSIRKFGNRSLIPRDELVRFLEALPAADISTGASRT